MVETFNDMTGVLECEAGTFQYERVENPGHPGRWEWGNPKKVETVTTAAKPDDSAQLAAEKPDTKETGKKPHDGR